MGELRWGKRDSYMGGGGGGGDKHITHKNKNLNNACIDRHV